MSENNQPTLEAPKKTVDEITEEQYEKDPITLLIESLDSGASFSTQRWEKEITIKDRGVDLACVLRELTSEEREDYMNFQAQKAKYGPTGQVTGLKDIKGLQTKLVSMGLYGPDGNHVPEATIKTWAAGLVKKLADIISRVSALDNFSETRAKNS